MNGLMKTMRKVIKMVNSIIDEKSGLEIHYGTIYGNDVSSFALDDMIQDSEDIIYLEALETLKEDFKAHIQIFCEDNYISFENIDIELMFEQIEDEFNQNYQNDYQLYHYTQDGYDLTYDNNDNSITILKSPYVCYAAQCSPCFPNGGYIRDKGSVLTYCLGVDWYDEYAVCENEPIEIEKVI